MVNKEKYVDESWKETAHIQKEKLKEAIGRGPQSSSHPRSAAQESPSAHAHHEEQVSQEAPQAQPSRHSNDQDVDENFLNYISSLGYQALMFLGEIPNPMSNLIEKNPEQAKFIIDILSMLRDKTKGNLSKKEENILNGTIYQLQMKYVEDLQKEQIP